MIRELQLWYQHQWIRAIDVSLAEQLQRQLGKGNEAVALMAGLVSYQLGLGHPCLDLTQLYRDANATLALPPDHAQPESLEQCQKPAQLLAGISGLTSLEQCQQLLSQSAAVNTPNSPLVLDGTRLYLRRYYTYEQRIKTDLTQRMSTQQNVDTAALKQVLDALFGTQSELSWQRNACAMAMRSLFTIVTGGPGTGKTYTVVRLLATLQQLREQAEPLRIRLAAPTGKAAARMSESIGEELGSLPPGSDLSKDISTEAVTLHRLLGTLPNSRGFRHNSNNPLHTDVLIIDEASMVDIEMMAAVVAALPAHARLILLGDKDQLASVEAGAILGQLCDQAEYGHYTPAVASWLNATSNYSIPDDKIDSSGELWPYLQHTTMFHESRRFDPHKGIGKLAHDVNFQHTDWLAHWLRNSNEIAAEQPEFDNIEVVQTQQPSHAAIKRLVEAGYAPLKAVIEARPDGDDDEQLNQWAADVLTQLAQFQLLTAIREGDWGMHQFNQRVAYWLYGDKVTEHGWFVGRPVMVTHNDYSMDLRNGDIGIVLQRRANDPLRVAFQTADGAIRWILPSRLTQVDTAYAMTIHKSQGSEFTHTVMIMPEHDVPILTKELLYTGITRAKERFTLVSAQPQLVIKAIKRRIQRSGGLAHG